MGKVKKIAVYCGTQSVYDSIRDSAWSLAANSSVDKIICCVEDDSLDNMPHQCDFVNASNQQYFTSDCVNYISRWSYMTLLRTALPLMFPDIDKVLYLDVDTIIVQNIDELWDIDLSDYYLAAVPEPLKTKVYGQYVNAGVMMLNLKKLREDGTAQKIIDLMYAQKMDFPDQDAINKICKWRMYELHTDYNVTRWTGRAINPKIKHWAGYTDWTSRQSWKDAAIYTPKCTELNVGKDSAN